jgi:carboxyl-terminal processing protease
MEQQSRLPLWFLVANWALIAGAFFLGVQLGQRSEPVARLVAALPQAQIEALAIVHREILQSHVDPQNAEALLENAIARMVADLDEYSRYVPPADVPRYEELNTGHYEGIGANFDTNDGRVVLHFPFAGGPADEAGLLPGDELLAVDGVRLAAAQPRVAVADLVRGPAGTSVRLQLRRGEATLDVDVERRDVQRPCVKWAHRVPGVDGFGYVQLTDFHPGAAAQLLAAIDALAAAAPLRGLVLDLRWNGGGSLEECISIARASVPSGLIVSQTRRDREIVERIEARPDECRFPTLPLAVLVNDDSASASEVLAGALQDHERAVIVGKRTHGKASVNTVYTWKGMPFRLKLTTGRYQTPDGRDIRRPKGAAPGTTGGIAPDVEADLTKPQELRALALQRELEPPARHREAFAALAPKLGVRVPTPPAAADDPQLDAALTALRGGRATDDGGSERGK